MKDLAIRLRRQEKRNRSEKLLVEIAKIAEKQDVRERAVYKFRRTESAL